VRLKWSSTFAHADIENLFLRVEGVVGRMPKDVVIRTAAPGASSFGWHTDVVDTLIYSVSGETQLHVAGRKTGSVPKVDVVLEPGDAAWAPALHFHRTVGGGDAPSLILSIGFEPPRAKRKKGPSAPAQVQKILENGGDFWGRGNIDLALPTGVPEDTYSVTNVGGHRDSKVLVIDLPRDSELLSQWQEAASNAAFGNSNVAYPGVNAPLPDGMVEQVSDVVAGLVRRVFPNAKFDRLSAPHGFVGQLCRSPKHPVLKESQYYPHIDEIAEPPKVVALHYLADDNVTWPFGGGTGFFRHREIGLGHVTYETCLSDPVIDAPKSHYKWVCERHLGYPNTRQPRSDRRKDFPGVTGEYGEYELVHTVSYRTNRIVLYHNNLFHSALVTAEGAQHLSCDPKAEHRRTTATYLLV